MEIKCKNCGREFTDQPNEYPKKMHVHQGEAMCEDCLIGMGAFPDHEDAAHNKLVTETAWFLSRPF